MDPNSITYQLAISLNNFMAMFDTPKGQTTHVRKADMQRMLSNARKSLALYRTLCQVNPAMPPLPPPDPATQRRSPEGAGPPRDMQVWRQCALGGEVHIPTFLQNLIASLTQMDSELSELRVRVSNLEGG